MISSVIKSLERVMSILDDIPKNIEKERTKTLSAMNDTFEDFYDQLNKDDKDTMKKFSFLKKNILGQMEEFCDTICQDVKEDVRIVEE